MDKLIEAIEDVKNLDSKLILIIGKPGSGKSKIVAEYSENTGIPIVDFSRILQRDTDDLKKTMEDFLKNYRFDVLLLDNKRAFYRAAGEVDLMDLLEDLAKDIAVVSTWNGFIEDGQLTHIVDGKETVYPVSGKFKYIIV